MSEHEGTAEEAARPLLRVVRGDPDDAELAALTAVLAAASPVPGGGGPVRRSAWADRAAALRHLPRPGPGAWRASGLPH
ncbi:acetyl-CoA carboxylase biotin carboxyl carrier protein subunit [Amycolatopsis antarctica]|uniref:Acetyl-CoA carboxylase biotin carboxyl carrier protein subunit n=1 Tax=Amycolatopsis antarctica TaxID=1854586 RepID=A0A263D971_9PSEU|nr:acyl-CoA carboxylase subunit epsilon [Amycolatopsis antarctica]OZM75064.1 acetyl-CoA carboxylase biotin carboxyl carrier protein subunit [Amycolatopsis antarctica]